MNLQGATVLVTGVAGFVGPYVARALLVAGARVHGLGNEPATVELPLERWIDADLRDGSSLRSAIADSRPDALVHLAGQSSAARSFADPTGTFRINALGTWNLLEAAREESPRARVLVVTSGEIYGPTTEGGRATERDPMRPVNPYALSKAAADVFAEIAAQGGQDVIRARAFGHTGPGQTPQFVIPTMAQQIASIESGAAEPVLRVGNLDVTRDLSDVRDVAEAYLALLVRGTPGAAYNVCRGEGVRLTDCVRRLTEQARVAIRIETDPARMRPADLPYSVGNPSAIGRDTGWSAQIPLDQTLRDVLDEWRAKIRV